MNNKQIDKLLTDINNALFWLKEEVLKIDKNIKKYNLQDFLFALKHCNHFLYLIFSNLSNIIIIIRSIYMKVKLSELKLDRFCYLYYYIIVTPKYGGCIIGDVIKNNVKSVITTEEFNVIKKMLEVNFFSTINKNYEIEVKQKHPTNNSFCFTILKL